MDNVLADFICFSKFNRFWTSKCFLHCLKYFPGKMKNRILILFSQTCLMHQEKTTIYSISEVCTISFLFFFIARQCFFCFSNQFLNCSFLRWCVQPKPCGRHWCSSFLRWWLCKLTIYLIISCLMIIVFFYINVQPKHCCRHWSSPWWFLGLESTRSFFRRGE